jgi:hypothetical protein
MSAVQGLNPGDTVSITGFDKLQDGAKVEIEDSPQEAADTPAGKSAAGQTR